jgi:hypothetical protein
MWSKISSWLFLLGYLLPTWSLGAVWVTPQNAGSVSPSVTSGGKIYYFTGTAQLSSPAFVLFNPIDLGVTIEQDAELRNSIQVRVRSDIPSDSTVGNLVVLTVSVAATSNTSALYPPVPISSLNGKPCNQLDSGCVFRNWSQGARNYPSGNNTTGHYYGVVLPSSSTPVIIGLNPASICSDSSSLMASDIASVSGCTAGSVTSTVDFATVMQLKFSIKSYSFISASNTTQTAGITTSQYQYPDGQVLDSTPGFVSFVFQSGVPTFQCSLSALNSSYFPGDGKIFLNTSIFSIFRSLNSTAPIQNLVVVGADAPGDPDTTSNFNKANSLSATVSAGPFNQVVSGFLNNKNYNLSFIAQDASGVYVGASPDCRINNVMTSDIYGFLPSNSNQCFIATAAFGSSEGFFLDTLRSFRDRILLKYDFSTEWVNWYYRWSPEASLWLVDHMLARYLVLLFLLPIVGFAWMALHQKVFFFFCLGSFFWWLSKKILLRFF